MERSIVVTRWYARQGDPTGLTIEECLAYYDYDIRQRERIEHTRCHFLQLVQT